MEDPLHEPNEAAQHGTEPEYAYGREATQFDDKVGLPESTYDAALGGSDEWNTNYGPSPGEHTIEERVDPDKVSIQEKARNRPYWRLFQKSQRK